MPHVIYLVRHAHAGDASSDEIRTLSHRGRTQVKQLAALLRPAGAFQPDQVWHSPLVRARETAELLIGELRLDPAWHELRELEPEADPALVARRLAKAHGAIAVFGHEPHLGSLASLLVTGESSPVAFVFAKATTLALVPGGARWSVRWQLSPDLFPE